MAAPMPPPGVASKGPGPGAPPPGQGQDGGGAITSLLMNVDKAIDHLALVIGQSKVTSPQEKQLIQQIDQAYAKLLGMLGVQGEPDEDDQAAQSGAQGQTVPPEAGGNPGAVPAP